MKELPVSVEDLMIYGRIDPGDERVVEACIRGAVAYFRASGVPDAARTDPEYVEGIKMLAYERYETRGATVAGTETPRMAGVRSIIYHLRYGDYGEGTA